MELQVGSILEGKVTSITKFGAFVALGNGKSGLVHISELANSFVNDVHDFLEEGQDVKVLVLSTDNGKINLSIKKALPQQERPAPRSPRPAPQRPSGGAPRSFSRTQQPPPSGDQSFEDKLKQFMSESDSKLSSVRQYSDHKTKTRRR